MIKNNLFKRVLAVMLTLALSAGLVLFCAPEDTYAASSGKLIKKVTHYYKSGSKWKKDSWTTYSYNKKKDPVKIVFKYKQGSKVKSNIYTYSYKYDSNGIKTEKKEYLKYSGESKSLNSITSYDKKGRVKKISYYYYEGDIQSEEVYTYGKNGYITKIKTSDGDTYSFIYKWNGKKAKALKVKLTGYGKYAQTKFNKNGFIEKPVSYTQADGDMTFSYKYKNGLVSSINLNIDNYYYEKDVITYTKKTIAANKYRAMINNTVSGNTCLTGTEWF